MTAQIDARNAEFSAQKIAQMAKPAERLANLRGQVADGKLTETGTVNGVISFRVIKGWDTGEVFRFDTKSLELSAQHGLEVGANGDVSLYLNGMNGPAWHGLGTVIPGGLSDADAVLRAGGLNWTVEKEAQTRNGVIIPGAYWTVRKDTDTVIGQVGENYQIVNNGDAYAMLSELIGLGMVCESAGVFDGGSKVFVTAEIPEPLVIDPNGIADRVRQFLAIFNSHDGKGKLKGVATPWRVLCGNTGKFALRDATGEFSLRHTKNVMSKMDEARKALGRTVEYYAAYAAEETLLVQSEFGHDDLDALIKEVWEMKPNAKGEISKRTLTLHGNRTETVHELFEIESARVGRNAFAAENAITGYVDHFAELRPRGDLKGNRLLALGDAIMNGTNDEPKKVAHERLMLRVR